MGIEGPLPGGNYGKRTNCLLKSSLQSTGTRKSQKNLLSNPRGTVNSVFPMIDYFQSFRFSMSRSTPISSPKSTSLFTKRAAKSWIRCNASDRFQRKYWSNAPKCISKVLYIHKRNGETPLNCFKHQIFSFIFATDKKEGKHFLFQFSSPTCILQYTHWDSKPWKQIEIIYRRQNRSYDTIPQMG